MFKYICMFVPESKQTRASIESDLDQLYGDGEKLGCDFFGVDLPKGKLFILNIELV